MKVNCAFEKRERNIGIKFNSYVKMNKNNIVSLEYENKIRYFQVDEVITCDNKDILHVTALNYGYYGKLNNIDLRDLIGLTVSIINDEQIIKDLNKESRYL